MTKDSYSDSGICLPYATNNPYGALLKFRVFVALILSATAFGCVSTAQTGANIPVQGWSSPSTESPWGAPVIVGEPPSDIGVGG